MKISSLVPANQICMGWPEAGAISTQKQPQDKWALIESLTSFLLSNCPKNFENQQVKKAAQLVIEREKSMTTGIGHGLAIPHATVPFLKKAIAAVCILKQGVDFDAIDHGKVHIVYLILLPEKKFQEHIQILANIARMSDEQGFLEKMLETDEPAKLWKLLDDAES